MNHNVRFLICFIFYLLGFIQACKVVDVGIVHFSSIYEGAPYRDNLEASVLPGSSESIRALQVFDAHVKESVYEVDGDPICFNIVIKESDYSHDSILQSVCALLEEDIRFLVSPFGTGPGNYTADIIEKNLCGIDDLGTVIQISGSTQDKNFGADRHATFGTMPTLYQMLSEAIPHFRAQAHNVTFVKREGVQVGDDMADPCEGLESRLTYADILKMDTIWYHGQYASAPAGHYERVAKEIKELDNELMIFCGLDRNIMYDIAAEFQTMDYMPGGVITTINDIHIDDPLFDYWVAPSPVMTSEFRSEGGEFIENEEQYVEIYKSLFPEHFDDNQYKLGIFTMFAGEIFLKSMQVAKTTDDIDAVLAGLKMTRFKTVFGELYYSSRHENQNLGASLQKFPTFSGVLGPQKAMNSSLIYPMPTWKERVHRASYHGIEILGFIISCLGITNILIWSLVLIFKQVQTLEILVVAAGAICLNIGNILWMPMHKTVASCVTVPIFIVLGLLLIIGMLVFNMSHEQYKMKQFYKYLGFSSIVSLTIATILFILWNIFAKPGVSRFEVDPHRVYKNYNTCDTKSLNGLFLGLQSIPLILTYAYGIYLSIVLKKKSSKTYIEKRVHVFSLYNTGLCAIIIIILEIVGISGNIYAQYLLRSIILGLGTTLLVVLSALNILYSGNLRIMPSSTSSPPSTRNKYSISTVSINDGSQSSRSESLSDRDKRQMYYKEKYQKGRSEEKELRTSIRSMKKELQILREAECKK